MLISKVLSILKFFFCYEGSFFMKNKIGLTFMVEDMEIEFEKCTK